MAIPYVKQTWTDGSGGGTPVSAARLGVIEQGAFDAHYMPAVQVSHSTTNSCTSAVAKILACDTEVFDQAGNVADTMHDNVTNNSRLTCRYAGVYLVTAANLAWSANPTTARAEFKLNAATLFGSQLFVADWRFMSISALRKLAVNDFVECQVTQSSGGTLTIAGSFEFGMVRVG